MVASSVKGRVAPLGIPLYLGYGVGSLGTGMFSTVPGLLLLFFLTDVLGVSPGLAGLGVFIPKIWDVITDPVMGSVSDRTETRWGRRRPYLLAGAILLPLFFALMFTVPPLEDPTQRFVWVVAMFIGAATGFTLFQVPYIAMPVEMTPDPHERTVIMSYRMVFMVTGILVAGGASPLLIKLLGGGQAGYARMSWVLAAVCGISLLAAFWGTRRAPYQHQIEHTLPVSAQLRLALQNHPFYVLVAGSLLQFIGVSVLLASVPYFVRYILRGGEAEVTLLFLCLVVPSLITMPVWVRLSMRLGKRRAYQLGLGLFALTNVLLLAIGPGQLLLAAGVVSLMGLAYAGTQLLPFSMLTDTIQHDAQRSGLRREGIFTGLWTACEKVGLAAGALITGTLLGASGFSEAAGGIAVDQPPTALLGIRLCVAVVPALLVLVGLPILSRYRLEEAELLDQEELHPGEAPETGSRSR